MKHVWWIGRALLVGLYLAVTSTFLLYCLFEWFPGLLNVLNLQAIRYYAQRAAYAPDPTLVFVPRQSEARIDIPEFRGDGYSPEYGHDVPAIPYRASYTRDGFRANSSHRPFDILVLGDSFIEIGESDEATFSEALKRTAGLSTLNLGRSWYGPEQYLELLKRYGPQNGGRYALLCFFDGNDAEDIRQYVRWQRGGEGGDYYHFILSRRNFFIRYLHALRDTYAFIRHAVIPPLREKPVAGNVSNNAEQKDWLHPDLGLIQLNGRRIPMRFNYWNRLLSTEDLVNTEEWERLRTLLTEFKTVSLLHRMIPVIVFIPTKIQVYGALFDEHSGERFLQRIREQLEFETNSVDALLFLAKQTDLQLVNLLPQFQAQARQGELLYYPFDTHWNMAGRQIAAEVVARSLLNRAL